MIATNARTLVRHLDLTTFAQYLISATALLFGAFLFAAGPASAVVNSNVRNACMSDYFEHCAGMEVGSAELRRCFNKAGPKLQPGCVSALVAAGEVSRAEVSRREGRSKVAGAARKGKMKFAAAKSRKAMRVAMRGSCVAGPSRPGASASSCRGVAMNNNASRVRRQVATLR